MPEQEFFPRKKKPKLAKHDFDIFVYVHAWCLNDNYFYSEPVKAVTQIVYLFPKCNEHEYLIIRRGNLNRTFTCLHNIYAKLLNSCTSAECSWNFSGIIRTNLRIHFWYVFVSQFEIIIFVTHF
jgi:hypothetical protein